MAAPPLARRDVGSDVECTGCGERDAKIARLAVNVAALAATRLEQTNELWELKAERAPGPNGRTSWVVEMPEEGWTSSAVAEELNRPFTPWWWGNKEKSGKVHYVQDLFNTPFEEIMPRFLCGFEGDNIWSAPNLTEEVLCPECLVEIEKRGLPPAY